MTAALMLAATAPAAAAPIEPCLNYMHREEAGRVEIDLRPDRSGAFTTLSVFWFIDDVPARPGVYFWNHIVNERTDSAVHIDAKDDNLHTALPMLDELGRPRWNWGDIYGFQATHYSPATRTTYVAAVNRCRITPRI